MDGRQDREIYGYIPGFAVIVVLALTLAFAPSLIPRPIRDALGLTSERLEPQQDVGRGGSFAFLAHQPGDRSDPVGYDPCKPIRVRVNPLHAPEGHLPMIREALDRVGAAAGLRFEYVGTTDDRPRWERTFVPVVFGEPRTSPVLISFADADEVAQLAGRVVGIGGSVSFEERRGRVRYVTGGVTLDAPVFARLQRSRDGREQARAIVLHELAHLVGLDHVDDPAELMNAENLGLADFGRGDLAGLAKVGATPCG